jgi:dodecin
VSAAGEGKLSRSPQATARAERDIDGGQVRLQKEDHMSVAKVEEISATSSESFEKAVQDGLARASKTLRNIRSAWIKEMRVNVRDNKVTDYQVNMQVTFVLDD